MPAAEANRPPSRGRADLPFVRLVPQPPLCAPPVSSRTASGWAGMVAGRVAPGVQKRAPRYAAGMVSEPAFTLGVEEEYLLIDPDRPVGPGATNTWP